MVHFIARDADLHFAKRSFRGFRAELREEVAVVLGRDLLQDIRHTRTLIGFDVVDLRLRRDLRRGLRSHTKCLIGLVSAIKLSGLHESESNIITIM